MDKGRSSILFLSLLMICLGVVAIADSAASDPAATSDKAKSIVQVLDPVGVLSSEKIAAFRPAKRLKELSGKKVWVVVADYGSTLMPAVARVLTEHAPGVRVEIKDASKEGNPFFMLKPANRPDAAIAGTGLCEATTLDALNFARQAEKLNIPAVIFFQDEVLFAYQEALDKIKLPSVRAYATSLPAPARPGDPERLAQRLMPQIIEGLTQPLGDDRPRICFTGTEDKAQAYFEALRWTGGMPFVLPTEERVAALLKGTSHSPAELVGVMAPGMRQATVEKVAIQAVMAGCTPGQMPLALALAEMLCQTRVAEELGQRHPPVLQITVGGPAVGTIGVAGSPGENAIGRLARLMLIHLAGIPGPVLEAKRLWATLPEEGKGGESTVALFDVDRAEIWKQSTTVVDRWR